MNIKEITDYIFIGAEPCKADAIFVVGGSLPDAARLAADLYHRGFANTVIIGGKYSVKRDNFPLPEYETEYDFYRDILLKKRCAQRGCLRRTGIGIYKAKRRICKTCC